MSKIKTLVINKNDANIRLDKFLSKTLENIPNSLLYKYIREKRVKINGKRTASPEIKLCENDILDLYIADEFFKDENKAEYAFMRAFALTKEEIAYEDENILIIDKKSGETVHSNLSDEESGASGEFYLIDRAIKYLYDKKEYLPESENSFVPALCNRLDRNTKGLVIMAKNAESLRLMNEIVKQREVKKTYLCEVWGIPEQKSALLSDFLYKDRNKNRVYIFKTRNEAKNFLHIKYDDDIKTVVTGYRVLASKDNKALLSVDLITGRTHQIRAHLSYIGHPIVGDGKYGISHDRESFQQLCAFCLEFDFKSDKGVLEYLNHKKIYSSRADFAEKYGIDLYK